MIDATSVYEPNFSALTYHEISHLINSLSNKFSQI